MSPGVQVARPCHITPRPTCSPCREDIWIISLRECEDCSHVAFFGSSLEHAPRRKNISLGDEGFSACQQSVGFTGIRVGGHWLLRLSSPGKLPRSFRTRSDPLRFSALLTQRRR